MEHLLFSFFSFLGCPITKMYVVNTFNWCVFIEQGVITFKKDVFGLFFTFFLYFVLISFIQILFKMNNLSLPLECISSFQTDCFVYVALRGHQTANDHARNEKSHAVFR